MQPRVVVLGGGVAGMDQRHQLGRCHAIEAQGALRNPRPNAVLNLTNSRGQLLVSHGFLRVHLAVMRVELPPRGVKSPTSVAEMGRAHLTTSDSMRFTTFS